MTSHAPTVLKFQSAFASGIGELFNGAVILVAITIEDREGNSLFFGTLGDDVSDNARCRDAALSAFNLSANIFLHGRSRGESVTRNVVDKRTVNVLESARNQQARTFGCSFDFGAQMTATALL